MGFECASCSATTMTFEIRGVIGIIVLYLALKVLAWKVFVIYQSDLRYWLEAVTMVVFLMGLLEIALIWRVFRQTYESQSQQPV